MEASDSSSARAEQPTENRPSVSFGVPVYNGEASIRRLLDSLLAQDLGSLEVVVCDNASTDSTPEICREYAARDPRVRFVRNETNIGQIENFNKVLDLARGEYFRWIGVDDWLEPAYASACVEVFRAHPEFIGVTTYQDHIGDDGSRDYCEYRGRRLDSPDPADRFDRMLWFFTADYRFIDPIYTMFRRDELTQTQRVRVIPRMDMVLSAELSLKGPFGHVPRCLAHRGRTDLSDRKKLQKRYHPTRHEQLKHTKILTQTVPTFVELVRQSPMSAREKVGRLWPIIRYAGRETYRHVEPEVRHEVGRVLRRWGLR
jgi:glycosyltransferase involved in cell wall biosynthesis